MNTELTRRRWLRIVGVAGVTAGFNLAAQEADNQHSTAGETSIANPTRKSLATVKNGKVIQPTQDVPVTHKSHVLVIGGGAAGVCAALGARRAGADVILVERYGQLGGTFTAGNLPVVSGTHSRDGKTRVLRGIGGEILERLSKLRQGILGYDAPDPTVDVEVAKYLLQVMIEEAGVKLVYHGFCAGAIVESQAVKGAVFEGKQGRLAMLGDIVVDATGDGDVLAFAGAAHSTPSSLASLNFRVGNLDQAPGFAKDAAGFREALSKELRKNKVWNAPQIRPTPLPDVEWVSQDGVEINPLNVEALTRAECVNRQNAWQMTEFLKKQPGCADVELLEVAWTLRVRVARVLEGVKRLTDNDLKAAPGSDTIGLCPSVGAPIPFGILLPKKIDRLIVAGRAVSVEGEGADPLRSTAGSMITGHAAGVAAALAAKRKTSLQNIPLGDLRNILQQQGAFLG